ncbi:hypothetical protein M2451_004057 [Dysgonomonas sp. PFB1-18]|uniref:hypothetical protein n=1 Tax=unclassified Dysgonomonas TaxID=2630389 RepID=UPI002472F558|nr:MULTISPECIES: hypothetical protein [unclassified Dysgonomonas]MDH6310904.1 hypothetical protein [Dysgonomonas sp. PF1-14]MDH6341027.1 hypothetical protein [Dysgonomonas sp. PF1-16]MDH6382710.1 hypothetical protein [Dysgonomonas sp. PFB1-18]MDH6400027.1 hypothetical protein [Dysgonomonas sp. PF1-23]
MRKVNSFFFLVFMCHSLPWACSREALKNNYSDLTDAHSKELEIFKKKFDENEIIIDSIKQTVNKLFNYPIEISVDAINAMDYHSVPYYGMSDGSKAFIFSLHFKKVYEVNIYYQGDNRYTIMGSDCFFISDASVTVKPTKDNNSNTNFLEAKCQQYKKEKDTGESIQDICCLVR